MAILKQAGTTGRRSEVLKMSPASQSNTFLEHLSWYVVHFLGNEHSSGFSGYQLGPGRVTAHLGEEPFFSPKVLFCASNIPEN